jgi:acyl-CoA synthetase (AMP-forming)/AMP-acid ligase II/thioesterase domain-containing protein/acyl carrier protein
LNHDSLAEQRLSTDLASSDDGDVLQDGRSTLNEALRRVAAVFPDRPAFVSTAYGPLTHAHLQDQIDRVRLCLRDAGLGSTARIGILVADAPQAALATVAVACCAVAVPVDPRLTPEELRQFLGALRFDALALVRGGPAAGLAVAEDRQVPVIEAVPTGGGRLGLDFHAPRIGPRVSVAEPEPDAPAFILRSSGTTAQPKLIPFSHRNMLAAAARWQTWFRLTAEDRCLAVSAPYYSHGLKVSIFTPLLTGGSIAFPANGSLVDPREWFGALRPTWYSAGPTLHRAVLDVARSRADVLGARALRFVSSGGAPLPSRVQEGLEEVLGVPVLEHYGSSEAAQIAANVPLPGASKRGTVGRPWPDTLAIVGQDGRPLPPGQQGEVRVRGATVTPGYLGNTETGEAAFVEGWLRTGDIGSLDDDGFLTLHGRLRELINRGGEKISPQEIDSALLRHPAVVEAAAFAVPHPRLGEDVAAAVVLRPGSTAEAADLREFLRRELVSFKVPRRILILDQLPKGVAGKVQRRRLSERFAAEAGDSVSPSSPAQEKRSSTLEDELLAIWRRLLQSDALTIDDSFFDKGGDSLLATEMLIETEKLLGHVIPESVMVEAETIRELVPKLVSVTSAGNPVVRFHADSARTPLFWFHGDFSDGGYYVRRLVSLLGVHQPVTSIAPHGLNDETIPASIAQMAAERLPLILEQQPEGPYLLGGYCNGAFVALEAARLLLEAGHKVEMVALIDPPTTNVRPWSRAVLRLIRPLFPDFQLARGYERLGRFEETAHWPATKRFRKVVVKAVRKVLVKTRSLWRTREGTFSLPPATQVRVRDVTQRRLRYSMAMARYLPRPVSVPILFFSASFDGRAWSWIGSSLDNVQVHGGHHRCVKDHTASIADPMRARLEGRSALGRSEPPQVAFAPDATAPCHRAWEAAEGRRSENAGSVAHPLPSS